MSLGTPQILSHPEIMQCLAGRVRSLGSARDLRILEAGCGQEWPIDLAGLSYTLVGVDADPDPLRSRRDLYNDLDETIVADLCELDLPDKSFDVIYSAFLPSTCAAPRRCSTSSCGGSSPAA